MNSDEPIEVSIDDLVTTIATVGRLNRAQELMTEAVMKKTGLTKEQLNDADPGKMDAALKEAVHEIFQPEIVSSWIRHNVGATISFAVDTHNISHLAEGEPIVDVEEEQKNPETFLNTLFAQMPLVLYAGYILGKDESSSSQSQMKEADEMTMNTVLLSLYLGCEPSEVRAKMEAGAPPEADLELLMQTCLAEISQNLTVKALANLGDITEQLVGKAKNPEETKGNAQSLLIGLAMGLRLRGELDGVRG